MGSMAYLVHLDKSIPVSLDKKSGHWQLAAKCQLPVFWLALFRLEDIKAVEIAGEYYGTEDFRALVPCLLTSTQKARSNFAARKKNIARHIPNSCYDYFNDWENYLAEKLGNSFVQLEMSEMTMDFYPDTSEFERHLNLCLKALESDNHEDWTEILRQACLDDPDVARFGMCGFDWECEMGWR